MFLKNTQVIIVVIQIFTCIAMAGDNIVGDIKVVEKIMFTNHPVYNPWRMTLRDNHIFIIDPESENTILHFDTSGIFINSFGPIGQGPGELGDLSRFCGIRQNQIIISNWRKLHIFDFITANFIQSTFVESFGRPIQIFNDAALAWGMSKTAFIIGYPIDVNFKLTYSDTIFFGKYIHDEELSPCRQNPLLKQGPVYNDNDKNIFFAFYNSSLIIGFDDKGKTIFKTTLPYNIPIPEVIRYRPGGELDFSAPVRNKHPEVTVSVSGDKSYIYTVYSGTILKSRKDLILNMHNLGQGEILNIYNKQTSEYLGSYRLPFPVRDIVATDKYIYALSVDPEISILKLKKPVH